MKNGTKMAANALLKAVLVICVLWSALSLAGFVFTRVPPYNEGQCLSTPNPLMSVKVVKNHALQGISDIEVTMMGETQKGMARFTDLRDPNLQAADCPK